MATAVLIDDIEEGMILNAPVTNNSGQVLLGPGIELGPKHVKFFKMWGISSVMVEGGEETDEVELDETSLQLVGENFSKRVFWTPRNDHEEELLELGIKRAVWLSKKKKDKDAGL